MKSIRMNPDEDFGRPVKGFPRYIISDKGEVYSSKHKRFLKPQKHRKGYLIVNLYRNQSSKLYGKKIHRLVAEAYIPNPDNKPQVDHINRDRQDNRVENLRWATMSENQLNKGKMKNNTSGFTNISFDKHNNQWRFEKKIKGIKYQQRYKNIHHALWFKFMILLLYK
jgi:hypothetical protein